MIATNYWFWDRPSWGWAEVWALIILLGPSLLLRPAKGQPRFLLSLIKGTDGRWSTSKTSALLWTYGLLFALLAILFHTRGHGLDNLSLSDQYLLLLGIPAAAAVSSKAITQSKIATKQLHKPDATTPPTTTQGIGQLFSADDGRADLLDSQYFAFSLLLLCYFLLQFLTGESTILPKLPDTLVGLTGVSAVGYVAKKGVQNKA